MGRFLSNAEKFSDKQVAETLDMLVAHGLERGASDIHLEPHERFVLVRFRIDGSLRGTHKLPRQALGTVMAQLKKRASLRSSDTALPQDGQYEVRHEGHEAAVHVAVMPVYGGEKAVLHLMPRLGKPKALEHLGFWGDNLKTLQNVLATPHGLLLVSGPRRSGVSSTLFSLLEQLNSPLVSIATVELRVKHRLPGVNHAYAAPSGMTVLEGLQAALKQDPNIIMLGDLDSSKTADTAVHAAATGHLVAIGLRAENAAGATLRVCSAGVEPFLVASVLRAAVGQRLVRTLCSACKERYALDTQDAHRLEQTFGLTTPAAKKRVHELEQRAAAEGLGATSAQLSSTPNRITHLWRPNPEGCSQCGHTGYQGQTAILEVLANTEGLQQALMSRDRLSLAAVHKLILKDGFMPMALDGLVKALRGQTTIEEVLYAVHATPPA